MLKSEFEQARKRWIKRVILTFLVLVVLLIGTEKALKAFGLPEIYFKILFLVFGVIYLIQIFSYRNIRCRKCGNSIFT